MTYAFYDGDGAEIRKDAAGNWYRVKDSPAVRIRPDRLDVTDPETFEMWLASPGSQTLEEFAGVTVE